MINYVCDLVLFRFVLLKRLYDKDWFAREIFVIKKCFREFCEYFLYVNKSGLIVFLLGVVFIFDL